MTTTKNPSLPIFFLWVAALLWSAIANSAQPQAEGAAPDAQVIVALVNGDPIYQTDVLRRLRAVHGSNTETAKADPNHWQMLLDVATQSAVTDKLLLQAAVAEGMALFTDEAQALLERSRKSMGERAFEEISTKRGADLRDFLVERELINRYKKKLFSGIVIGKDVLKEYYRGHKDAFAEPAQVRLEVFTFGVRKTAGTIYKRWQKGESFDTIAEAYLAEGERVGRRTRWMPISAVPVELREKVGETDAGTILEPVQIADKFYVVRVIEQREARRRGFDEVQEEIRATILDLRKSTALDEWYQAASREAKIEYMRQ
jgi:parvulin-like peptidyl-prolyl isomerase